MGETQSTTLGHVMIHVPDVVATVRWYQEVFGFSVKFQTPDSTYTEMVTGTTTLAFSAEATEQGKYGDFVRNSADILPVGFHLALQVSELDMTYQRALTAGAVSINPPQPQSWGASVARIRDLNGVLVAIGTL